MRSQVVLADLRPGDRFAGYAVETVAGRGGMGVVYRAYEPGLERRVALKLLAPELSAQQRFRDRFLRETKVATSLEHPHVVPVHAAGEHDGRLFIVTRFVEGEDLGARLSRERWLEPPEAFHVLADVASALDAAHGRGLVHRDVKPANILLDRGGEAYLSDFGLAKPVGTASGPTRTGELLGTLAYLAPEQIADAGVDGRADQYALACVAFECLTGTPPFEREGELQLLWAHVHDPPARLTERRPGLPAALDRVVRRALAKDPGDRFPTCSAFVEAMQEACAAPVGLVPGAPAEVAAALFAGRHDELRTLLAALEAALTGRGSLVLVAGEPGIGKSRLLEELAAHARRRGARVLVGRAWEAGGAPPFWPWVEALRPLGADWDPERLRSRLGPGAAHVARLVPEPGAIVPDLGRAPPFESEHARFRLFDATAAFLREVSLDEPLVLLLDDLHAADEPSLLLLRFLTRELDGARVLVVASFRDVDPPVGEPLASSLAELGREPTVERLRLGGLAEADVAAYIGRAAGAVPGAELTAAIHAETEGNPLFVAELVRLLDAESLTDNSAGLPPELGIPPGVRDVIRQRLGRLPPACAAILSMASAFGREFELEALERASGSSGEELLDALDAAIDAEILSEAPGPPGRLRFSHGLVQETLYEGLSGIRRRRLHGRLADMLEELYAADPEPHLAELAHHYGAAGNAAKALDYARSAGDRALRQLAYEEAARLYRLALGALEQSPSRDPHGRCDLLLALGDALSRAGDLTEAKDTFLSASRLARALDAPDRLARAALGYGGRFVWARAAGDTTLVELLEDALVVLRREDTVLRSRVLARLAGALRDDPVRARRLALSAEAVELARRSKDALTLIDALGSRFMATWAPDTVAERLAIADERIELAERAGELEKLAEGPGYRFEVLMDLGDIGGADAAMDARLKLQERLGQPSHDWLALMTGAMRDLLVGRFDEAERLSENAFAIGRRALGAEALFALRLQRFAVRREQGRLAEIDGDLRRAVGEHPNYPVLRALVALVDVELGHEWAARDALAALAQDDFAALPFDNEWLLAVSFLAETVHRLADAERAGVLSEQAAPYAHLNVNGGGELSTGAVSRYLALLATTMRRYAEAERHFEHAIAMNDRMGARPWLAHAQHDYAGMLLERDGPGDRARARALLGECLTTCRAIGMPALEEKASALRKSASAPA
jgi:tetratricopeptide (TPR) repeat protein